MRVVLVDEFLRLPAGTVFSYYVPSAIEGFSPSRKIVGLYAKGETMAHALGDAASRYGKEFSQENLLGYEAMSVDDDDPEFVREFPEAFANLEETGEWGTTDGVMGLVEDERVYYAVYEPEDLRRIIGRLGEAREASRGAVIDDGGEAR